MAPPGFLPPVPGLVFHEDIHRYRYQSNWVPWSVTRITGHDMSPSKRSNILKTKAQWEPRGNAVHNAMEAFLTGKQDLTTVDGYEAFNDWISPLVFHPIWDRYQPIACEHRMVSPDASVAGSLDVLLSNGSEIVLCDLKTQSNARAAPYDTSRQLGAYCWLLDHCHGIQPVKCITLWARPGHTAQTIADPSDCLSSWNDCYAKFLLTQPNF